MGLKQVKIDLIDPQKKSEPYTLLQEVRQAYHKDIKEAKIALAWRKGIKVDADGHLMLGRCNRSSDLQKEFVDWDFVIELNHEVWMDDQFDTAKKRALLDHELSHIKPVMGPDGPSIDSKNRRVWAIRQHDIAEFADVVTRHGCYKHDLEVFAEALAKSKAPTLFTPEEEKAKAVESVN